MEEAKNAIVKAFKNMFGKKSFKRKIILIVAVIVVAILLSGSVYFITVDDGTYDEDDWSSVPYAAGEYVNRVSTNSDGTISSSLTTQELWDMMLDNGSRVDLYLDSPEELARLMKAEIVTQYPDTRPNPDEAINWQNIIDNPDALQGIVKFKRADSNGNKTTMTYADPATFQSYIDEYNRTGSQTAKQNAVTHFTLKQTAASQVDNNRVTSVAAGDGVMTDVSQAIIDATNTTGWPGANWCARWVGDVYDNAGLTACRHATAYEASKHHIISTDMSAIPIGAAVYGTGKNSSGAGHVGIYIGGRQVVDSQGSGVVVSDIDTWLSWQSDVIEGQQGWLGWGWHDNNKIRGTTQDPNVTQNNGLNQPGGDNNQNSEPTQKATVVPASGDGYTEEYISSAGIKYKHFKQFKGSYANNPYWNGTIHTSGCGPSSVAILASGLTNLNYTPADTATQMMNRHSTNCTNYTYLKEEMDSLGMTSEIIHSPTAEQIKDNLKNGKVMLVSVNSNTIFTGGSHIMALVDINTQEQVYICNPGSSSLYGWYDVSEIMKGCNYIVTTEAGAAGIAQTSNGSACTAVVATWQQSDTTLTTNDPNVSGQTSSTYSMTTTNINYQEMVEKYTMPFDFLWALLVVGEDKDFVFEIADLIYGSDIQITIHDNLTVNTNIDEWKYTQQTKAIVNASITASYNGTSSTQKVIDDTHDPYNEGTYTTTKTVVTQTNTVEAGLTKANVWLLDCEMEYTYASPVETSNTETTKLDDKEYPDTPSSTGNSFSCSEITTAKETAIKNVKTSTNAAEQDINTNEVINVNYYSRYKDIEDKVTSTVSTQKYVKGTPTFNEKLDPNSAEPNFVTIFNKNVYSKNKSNVKSAASWLFEILETNESTNDMVDLMKYILYKSTGTKYDGIDTFDFGIFYPNQITTVAEGDYIVHIDKSSQNIVITDVNTLKTAFSGYSGSSELIKYAQDFLDLQEQYRVNAVFAAAVSISETGAGRAGHAVDGKNNWFNIECTCGGNHGRFETYSSVKESIEAFYKQISVKNYYFTAGKFTVSEIGMTYCENADAPGGWIDNTTTFMAQMFNAAGITPVVSETTDTGEAIIEAAKLKLGCSYVWGATGPNTFDCSGLTQWSYKQVGISIPRTSSDQKASAPKKVPVSEARVGDILWRSGHVALYIGNNQYIHAPQTGDVVKIVSGVNSFTYALQYY